MASFFFSSLVPIKNKTFAFSPQPNHFLAFKNSKISSSKAESSPNSAESLSDQQDPVKLAQQDPVKLALAKPIAYKNSTQSGLETSNSAQGPPQEAFSVDSPTSDVQKEVPLAVKIALEKAKEYKKNKTLAKNEEVVSEIAQNSGVESAEIDEKGDDGGKKEIPLAVKLAMEKAKEYKKNKGVVDTDSGGDEGSGILASGREGGNESSIADKQPIKNSGKKGELTVSSLDFMGLGFADKRSGRSLPAGLVPLSDPFPEGDLPEVEILVGDTSNFDDTSAAAKASPTEESDADLYKPKVSTWGVFPRPNDISKTYGGGRTLRPGEALETAEERAAKQARTRQMVAAYKTKIGLNIDPKLKFECEKALKDGDSLMDLGKLKEALPFYEIIMEKLVFESELHGLAALQWSICQDSLSRPNEARVMYEKLQSHPSPKVSKKARQLFFSFQAMEMLKVKSLNLSPRSTGYQNYFDAFVQDKTNYPLEEDQVDESGLNQAIPYVIFLVSPIFMVLLIAAFRS